MQKYALQINKVDGSQFHAFGTVGTQGHREAEQMRDTWQQFQARDPRYFFSLVEPDGTRVDIVTGDITDVTLIVGGHMRGEL